LAYAAQLRFGNAAIPTQGFLARLRNSGWRCSRCRPPSHGIEGLVDPAAGFQPVGKKAALPQLPLKAASNALRDQGTSGGALHKLAQLGAAIMNEGHGLCLNFQ